MGAEFVLMTILGCNAGGSNCHYIATVDQRWETISLCNDVSESRLQEYRDRPYPVIVAVCQKPEPKVISDISVKPLIKQDGPSQDKEWLTDRVIEQVQKVLPTTEALKAILRKPVRLVESSYSWVAKRFE